MDNKEDTTMTLNPNDYFIFKGETNPADSLLKGLNLYVKNNGSRQIKVTSDEKSILIYVEAN